MVMRAKSNYFDDIDRLAENLESNFPGIIDNIKTMNKSLKDYMDGQPIPKFLNIKGAGNKEKLLTQILYKRGGGQRFRTDEKQTAKTTYPNTLDGREEYREKGAGKSDLDGIDTRQGKKINKKKLSKNFIKRESLIFVGHVKNQIVKARKETIKVKNKNVTRFRDRKGRFVKVRTK